MKQLLIVRHAKSSWSHPGLSDFDRPLNERGKHDAPVMAERVKQRGIHPDLLVSSPAKRALSTARRFAAAWHISPDNIICRDELYHAPLAVFYHTVQQLADYPSIQTAIIFSHNPGITAFANHLGVVHLDNMPTCGVLAVQADTNDWSAFADAGKTLMFFDYPKLIS